MTSRAGMLVVCAGCTAACGRVGFDPLVGGDGAPARVCDVPATAPSEVSVAGAVFNYQSFLNEPRFGVGGASAVARDPDTSEIVDMTSGDTCGSYAVRIPTGGVPRRVALQYGQAGWQSTTVYSDVGLYEDTIGSNLPLWTLGDGPIWGSNQMMNIYAAVDPPLTWQSTTATLNVAVRDCAGDYVARVVVAMDPAPVALRYQNVDGEPLGVTETEGPFGHAFGFDLPPGPVRITGSTMDGRQVVEQTVTVAAGETTLATLRVLD